MTDTAVGANRLDVTVTLECSGGQVCIFLNGYSSSRSPAVAGSGTLGLVEGGQLELDVDRRLDEPPVDAWVLNIEPTDFDNTIVGVPRLAAGIIFGINGGPALIPGLTLGPFGPADFIASLSVGNRFTYELRDSGGKIIPIGTFVGEPSSQIVGGVFEMLDATRFRLRDLVVQFEATEVIEDLGEIFPELAGVQLTIHTSGSVTLNLSGELLIQLAIDRDFIRWTPLAAASGYDVVRGSLDVLRAAGGDFAAATDACVVNDLVGTTLAYGDSPLPGSTDWFLVRGAMAPGSGGYDTTAPSQVAPRNEAIEASPFACP